MQAYKIFIPELFYGDTFGVGYKSEYSRNEIHKLVQGKAFRLSGKKQFKLNCEWLSYKEGILKALLFFDCYEDSPYAEITWQEKRRIKWKK